MSLVFYCSIFTTALSQQRVAFVDLESRDTLYKTALPPGATTISFTCPKRAKRYDAAVMIRLDNYNTYSIVVPLTGEATNTYSLDTIGIIPFYLTQTETPRFVQFSGNAYLNAYSDLMHDFVARPKNTTADTAAFMNAFVDNLYTLFRRFDQAEMAGYHLYSMESNPDPQLEKALSAASRKKYEKMLRTGKGFFYNEGHRISGTVKAFRCTEHPEDQLLFQSANSTVDQSLLKGYIHVLVFWATWCGPCKLLMKQLSELNNTHYGESPVLFHAVSSESDMKKLITFFETHPEYKGLSLFHDSHLCMQKAYHVEQYPTLLIFDKTGKLLARDPAWEAMQPLIDKALAE